MERLTALPLADCEPAVRGIEIPKFARTDCVNPEQSVPFVRLVPPYTYGFPTNCNAKLTIDCLVPDVLAESEVVVCCVACAAASACACAAASASAYACAAC